MITPEDNPTMANVTRPNILLIMADQWRADCLGLTGNDCIDTPNLDCLFASGCSFSQAYSAVPSCIAARASLLTGMSQRHHGRVGYKDGVSWDYEHTLPGTLARAGYHTHCAGKMHVHPARNLVGFHSVDLHDGYLHSHRRGNTDKTLTDDYLPWLKEHCGIDADLSDAGVGCNGYSVVPWPYEERYHPTSWVTTKAIDFLRRRDTTKPFFLKASYHRPHPPLDPPLHYLNRYADRQLPPLACGDWAEETVHPRFGVDSPAPRGPHQIDLARRAYYAQITFIDNQINRLIHALNEHAVCDNTLILFLSDHGEMLYDHNRVAKSMPYDGSARIPLLMRFPASWNIAPRHGIAAPVELRDIMPTLLDAAGVDIPPTVDGQSLLPLCRGEAAAPRRYLHGEHPMSPHSNHWITNGNDMYVWFSETGREQYFRLDEDPQNIHNRALQYPDRVAQLRELLIEELSDREEGYVENGALVPGRKPKACLYALSKRTDAQDSE